MQWTLKWILAASEPGAPMEFLEEATCIPNQGLLQDRYGNENGGSFSRDHDKKNIRDDVTIYNLEDIEMIATIMCLSSEETAQIVRRNLIVTMPTRAFVSARFAKIITLDGHVKLEWSADCSPCTRPGTLDKLNPKALKEAMFTYGFGGERAAIVEIAGSGIIRPGDPIKILQSHLPSYSRLH